MRSEIVSRITRILHDRSAFKDVTDNSIAEPPSNLNSDEPIALAAEFLRDTLIDVGIDE